MIHPILPTRWIVHRWTHLVWLALPALGCGAEANPEPEGEPAVQTLEPDSPSPTRPSRETSQDTEGLQMCCLLGAGCHPDSSDPPGGLVRRCHELGHTNQPEQCRAQYDECVEACNPTGMETEHACLIATVP